MAEVRCDVFGWFDGVYDIAQTNWSAYWKGVIPDGVVAGRGNELVVYGNSSGMVVYVKTGEGMVDNHKGSITSQKAVYFDQAATTYGRYDTVVMRAVYGNSGASYIALDVVKGTPAATPVPPALTQVSGDEYEIALADVLIPANATTIPATNVFDRRALINLGGDTSGGYWRNKVMGQ